MQSSQSVLAHEEISSSNGMVVAQHSLGARAGLEVLQKGGNAVDAAVTTAFAMGVTQPLMNGLGGGGVMIVRTADGGGGAVDYGMRAPAAATPDMYELEEEFEERGATAIRFSDRFAWPRVRADANLNGHTSVAVPGTLAGLAAALEAWGTIDLPDALGPAIELAEEGFPAGHHFTLALVNGREKLLSYPGTAPIYYPGGQPIPVGGTFVQKDHARALRAIARDGVDAFYRGEPAQRISEDVQANGGRLSASDFASYRAEVHHEPLRTTYRGVEVLGVPCLGATPTLFEMLSILDNFQLHELEYGSPDALHLVIEAVKLAAVDRFTWLGDAAPEGGPLRGLTSKAYALRRAAALDRSRAGAPEAGDPWPEEGRRQPAEYPLPAGAAADDGTTTLTTADRQGNFVVLTQTNHGFSGVVTPGVGVMLNNGMGWFYPGPETVNSVVPGGRGLHNMTPVILAENGRTRVALGASGGRRIWTAILQTIIHHVDFGMSLQEAIQAPRLHVETDDVLIDGRFPSDVRVALERRGHRLIEATPAYDRAPFSEPNGISSTDGGYRSGVYPVCKPTVAVGY